MTQPHPNRATIVIYFAGPYTAPCPWWLRLLRIVFGLPSGEERNVRRALDYARPFRDEGFITLVPHLFHFWDGIHPAGYEVWMRLDFGLLSRVDALLRLPGPSSGADREVELARTMGIPVFFDPESALAWARARAISTLRTPTVALPSEPA